VNPSNAPIGQALIFSETHGSLEDDFGPLRLGVWSRKGCPVKIIGHGTKFKLACFSALLKSISYYPHMHNPAHHPCTTPPHPCTAPIHYHYIDISRYAAFGSHHTHSTTKNTLLLLLRRFCLAAAYASCHSTVRIYALGRYRHFRVCLQEL
jgi:hypothetical protein